MKILDMRERKGLKRRKETEKERDRERERGKTRLEIRTGKGNAQGPYHALSKLGQFG
jgi:hypothetical protein